MIKLDVIRHSKRIKILNKIDEQDIAEFNSEPYVTVISIAEILKIPERDILAKIKLHEHITVDLEFLEAESKHVIHDGITATGRPIVTGLTWRGLKMICAEFAGDKINALARDIIIVDYISTNPRSLAHYFSKKGGDKKTSML